MSASRPLHEEIIARDKDNLDIFWLRDESLEDSDNLPDPDVLVREIRFRFRFMHLTNPACVARFI